MKRISSIVFPLFLSAIVCLTLFSCEKTNQKSVFPTVSGGTLIRIDSFQSSFIGRRTIDIWLPDDYNKEEKSALLFMHDGQMLFDSSTTWNGQEWGVDELFTDQGSAFERTVVVGIHNGDTKRHAEYFPQKSADYLSEELLIDFEDKMEFPLSADRYLQFLVEELYPYILDNYNVYENPESTFIAGSSMGGLISWYALCEYPNIFGGAACLSTHWPMFYSNEDNPMPAAFMSYLEDHIPLEEKPKFYFDTGTETLDSLYPVHQARVDSLFRSKGYDEDRFLSLIFEGKDHTERSWRERLSVPIGFLLKKKSGE